MDDTGFEHLSAPRKDPTSAECQTCGATILPRFSESEQRKSLWSGIRQHYWDEHRGQMLKGVRERLGSIEDIDDDYSEDDDMEEDYGCPACEYGASEHGGISDSKRSWLMERGFLQDPETGIELGITGKVGSEEPWEQAYLKEHHHRLPYIHGPPHTTVGRGPVDVSDVERRIRRHPVRHVPPPIAERHFMPHERFASITFNGPLILGIGLMLLGVLSPVLVKK